MASGLGLGRIWDSSRATFPGRYTAFSRLILLDRRGTGLSDHIVEREQQLTVESEMDDVRAVMDAAGTERAVLVGFETGFAVAAMLPRPSRNARPGSSRSARRLAKCGPRLPLRPDRRGLRRRARRDRTGMGNLRTRTEVDVIPEPRDGRGPARSRGLRGLDAVDRRARRRRPLVHDGPRRRPARCPVVDPRPDAGAARARRPGSFDRARSLPGAAHPGGRAAGDARVHPHVEPQRRSAGGDRAIPDDTARRAGGIRSLPGHSAVHRHRGVHGDRHRRR